MVTRRQREFLASTAGLAMTKGEVHYTDVADVLGVSRWTAYDVLCGLVAKGMLQVSHGTARDGGAGRSRVFFRPTRQGLNLLGEPRDYNSGNLWAETRQSLKQKVAYARERGVWNTLQERVKEISSINQPLVFCAYLLGALLVALRAVNQSEEQALLGHLLPLVTGPQAALAVFAGCILAYLVQRTAQTPGDDLHWGQLSRFEEQIRQLRREETSYLRDFTVDLMGKLWSGKTVTS